MRCATPVVFLLEDLEFGGTQRQTLELASRLDRARFSPCLVMLRKGPTDLLSRARDLELPCRFLTDCDAFDPLRVLPALWRYLASERPPLLHLMTALPNIWGRILGAALRLPGVIACCRGLSDVRGPREYWLRHLAKAHICNAEAIRDPLLRRFGLPEERVFLIPNGVDTDFFAPASACATTPPAPLPSPPMPQVLPAPVEQSREPCVLCIARMAPVKNHVLLLQAFARVLARMPGARLRLVGDGESREAVLAMAERSELRGRVTLYPGSADVRPFLRQAQVFVLASDYEGTPNAILEAMASGLPVAATRTGGSAEAVLHERTGLLTPVRDAEALADSLARLLRNPDERAVFGRAGRRRVLEHYSLEAMVRGHEDVYEYVLSMSEKHAKD